VFDGFDLILLIRTVELV